MKKTVTYIFSILVLCIAMLLPVETAYAANISISASKSSVEIGDTVTITISVPENVSGTLNVIYPADLLEYSKASAEVNANKAGTVAVSIGKNGLATSNKITITFKAKTEGEATVKANGISFFDNESYDAINLGDASAKITIKNETVNNELSSDYYLAKLDITAGSKKVTLSPAFNYRKTNYTATVDYGVTDVVVSVTRSSGKAEIVSMTGNGKVKLEVGANKIEIVVKAENGKTLTYVVTITRKEKPADPVDPPVTPNPPEPPKPATPDFEYGGTPLYAVETPDGKIPVNFVEKTVILAGGKEVLGLSFEKADLTVLYLENDNKAGSFYVYDVEDNFIYPFVKLSTEESYVIILMPEDEEVPAGYTACTLSIEGKGVVNAYQWQATKTVEMSDFYLIYCVNHNGTKGWYQYDALEGTYQRYVGGVNVPVTPPDTEPGITPNPSDPGNPSDPDVELPGGNGNTTQGDDKPVDEPFNWAEYKTIIICAVVFLAAVLVIIVINLILAATRKATAGDDDEEEEDDDEYEYFDDKEVFKRIPHPETSKHVEDTKEEELPVIDVESVMDVPVEEETVEESSATEETTDAEDTSDGEEEVEFLDL